MIQLRPLKGPVERPPFVRYLKARAEDDQEFEPTSAPRESFSRDRLQKNLEGHGARTGVHRIRRLHNKLGPHRIWKRRFGATTNSKHDPHVVFNLLNQ